MNRVRVSIVTAFIGNRINTTSPQLRMICLCFCLNWCIFISRVKLRIQFIRTHKHVKIYYVKSVKELKEKMASTLIRHLHTSSHIHTHQPDWQQAVMTVITCGLTLTSPSWLCDWLGWCRDVNRGTSLMLWLGLNYTSSLCFHQCQGRQWKGGERKRGVWGTKKGHL